MSPKVGCSGSSVMVGRFWVDCWWRGGLLVDYLGGPSSGCKRWLILLVASPGWSSSLGHGGCQMLGVNSRGLFVPEHKGGW
jgi:hypothetical protein